MNNQLQDNAIPAIMTQWFPGHMYKTQQALLKIINQINVVVEIIDARAPISSANPLLHKIIQHKPKLCVLNKADMADANISQQWLNHFKSATSTAILTNSLQLNKQQILTICSSLAPHRGHSFERPMRILVAGIPNVGKSTFINQLIGKKIAKTADIPAVTQQISRINLSNGWLLFDTPGILWHKITQQHIGHNLVLCNNIGVKAVDIETSALYLLEFLVQTPVFSSALYQRYNLIQPTAVVSSTDLLQLLQRKLVVNSNQMSRILVQDFRKLKFGRISLERPNTCCQ